MPQELGLWVPQILPPIISPAITPICTALWRPPQAYLLQARPGAREVWELNLSGLGDSGGTKPSVFLSQPQSNNKNSLVSPAQEPAPLQTAMVPPDYSFSASAPGCLLPLPSSSSCAPSLASWACSFLGPHRADCFVCRPVCPFPFIVPPGRTPSRMAELLLLLLLLSLVGGRVIRALS